MKDQHKLIKGYRDFDQEKIDLINSAKSMEQHLANFVKNFGCNDCDERWKSIAITHFEQGFMALVRAVAKPTSAKFKD